MVVRTLLCLLLTSLSACASSVGGLDGDRVDAKPGSAVDAGRADAVLVDARAQNADAATNIEVTVTASCLFLRLGPSTSNAKLPCTDTGAWCNVDDDVCILMGESASVTGTGQTGLGCDVDWYPLHYQTYDGWACGSFIAFPASSAAFFLPPDHLTLFPSAASGPKG